MPPQPCAHCGINYMRNEASEYDIALCNNCEIKHRKRDEMPKKKIVEIIDSEARIVVKLSKGIVASIEEYCLKENLNFDQVAETAFKQLLGLSNSQPEPTEKRGRPRK